METLQQLWPDVSSPLGMAGQARWWLAAAGGTAAAAWAAWVVWWRRRARRVLLTRHTVRVTPSVTFDPSRADVLVAVPRLHRLPQIAGLLPRRARAIRIWLMNTPDGLLEYRIQAPCDTAHVLGMPLYPGVEVSSPSQPRAAVPRILFTTGRGRERTR